MRVYLLVNEDTRSKHIQVREGEIDHAESNPLTFDGLLVPGEEKRLFCHSKFSFSRSRFVDVDDGTFSQWICLRDGSQRPVESKQTKLYTGKQIHQIAKDFEATTLPPEQFTHDAHIIIACWHLFNTEGDEVFEKIARQIIAYKAANESPKAKSFHVTMTKFWLLVVQGFLDTHMPSSLEITVNTILASKLGQKSLPFEFYSRERLFSSAAIESWVEPDMRSLDELTQMIVATNIQPG